MILSDSAAAMRVPARSRLGRARASVRGCRTCNMCIYIYIYVCVCIYIYIYTHTHLAIRIRVIVNRAIDVPHLGKTVRALSRHT